MAQTFRCSCCGSTSFYVDQDGDHVCFCGKRPPLHEDVFVFTKRSKRRRARLPVFPESSSIDPEPEVEGPAFFPESRPSSGMLMPPDLDLEALVELQDLAFVFLPYTDSLPG